MIEFSSNIRTESKLYPGIFYTVHVMSDAKRTQLKLRLAAPLAKLRAIQTELAMYPLPRNSEGEVDSEANVTAQMNADLSNLRDRVDVVRSAEMDPVHFEIGFVSIEGLTIDGVAAEEITAQMVREKAPEGLYQEILETVKSVSELTAAERKN